MKKLISIASLVLLSVVPLTAEIVKTATTNKTITKLDKELIDIAGKQRMLSQRLAKDYLYIGKKVAVSRAKKELDASLKEFLDGQKRLKSSINNEEILNLLQFTELSSEEFQEILKQPFNLDNAQIAIDLSESMLEGSQYVVDSLKAAQGVETSKIIAKAGRQRMLSQRIAKYYIAYQSGIKDKNTVDQMKEAVKEFSQAHKELMANSSNTPEINQKLHEIDKLWKIVYKFYLNIEKGGLPFIVYTSTNDITKKMDEITKLYVGNR
jgi:Xaa-Pro aminopeptidase